MELKGAENKWGNHEGEAMKKAERMTSDFKRCFMIYVKNIILEL